MANQLTSSEILELERDVLNMLAKMESKKYRVQNNDYRQLTNHLQYCLTTIRNISQTLAVEKSDPYNRYSQDYTTTSNLSGKKVKYMPDGSLKVVSAHSLNTTGDGWESQFDESMLIRPPCFQAPPQSLTHISTIRSATEVNRLRAVAAADPSGVQRL